MALNFAKVLTLRDARQKPLVLRLDTSLGSTLRHFFLFFLASVLAAGPLTRVMCVSAADFGIAEGSKDIVVRGMEVDVCQL